MLTPIDVVTFLQDRVDFNILLDEVQFDAISIEAAIRFSVAEFNAMTPVTSFTEATFPNEWLLLIAVAAHLMSSAAFLEVRNKALYRDGGITAEIGGNVRDYIELKNELKKEWREAARNMKTQQNMEQAYGSLSSGYAHIKRHS